jgi:hypothetical protein
MSDLKARVPQRIQHPAQRRRVDRRRGGRQEQEVDVGVRGQIASPIATDRDDGDPGRVAERLTGQLCNGPVDRRCAVARGGGSVGQPDGLRGA